MLTIEKVLILRTVELFAEIPDELLIEAAAAMETVSYQSGETIFDKGDAGSAMFIIVTGEVRIHDDDRTIAVLGARDVFGELAALDPEVRMASATALRPCELFKLDDASLYALLEERIEIARAMIRVLCRRVRMNNMDPT